MISLKEHKLVEPKRNPADHTWRALEEILAYSVVIDDSIFEEDKKKYLLKVYKEAKLDCIKDTSVRAKIGNINTLIGKGSFGDNNRYTIDVYNSSSNPDFLKIYDDIYINFWRKSTLKTLDVNIFENHDIKLLFSKSYFCSKHAKFLSIDLKYFSDKIVEYKKSIFEYVTPQHYIEHINAIGHLDKIIILSKDEAQIVEDSLNPNIPGDISDFMGMFIPSVSDACARQLSYLTSNNVKKGETIILLCPDNMNEMMHKLAKNHPTLMDMVDKVFSHEIGHLAFYFYYSALAEYEGWRTIAEKQANWIASISHNGKMDDLIEEICSLQPPKYYFPILLKQNTNKDYCQKVDGLYLR